MVSWELCDVIGSIYEGKQGYCGGSALCIWKSSLLCRDICLMQRMKYGYNSMINISIDMYTMLEYMLKCKHKIGTQEHEYVVQLCRLISMKETIKGYIFII